MRAQRRLEAARCATATTATPARTAAPARLRGDEYLDECSGHVGPNGDYHDHMTNECSMAIGSTYNNAAGGVDCCFEKQCIGGEYQSDVGMCVPMSCVP